MVIPVAEKETYIKKLFGRIASKYDFLNDMMTLWLHRAWKQELINRCSIPNNATVLDLCTGTGDIAFMWAKNPKVAKVIALDSCEPMLTEAKKRQKKLLEANRDHASKIDFVEGDALILPLDANSIDAVTVGFGLRNVVDLDKAILEMHRVLKTGAYAASLDLGHPSLPLIESVYKKLLLNLIPSLGANFASDKEAYQYLVDSLRTWPKQEDLCDKFWNHGFSACYYKNLVLGAIAIVVARK